MTQEKIRGKNYCKERIEEDLRLSIREHHFGGFVSKIGRFSLREKSYPFYVCMFDLFSLLLLIQNCLRCIRR